MQLTLCFDKQEACVRKRHRVIIYIAVKDKVDMGYRIQAEVVLQKKDKAAEHEFSEDEF